MMRIASLFLMAWTLVCWPAANTPPTRPLSDSQIEQDMRMRYAKSKMAARKFTFRVQGGIATIDGKTDVIQHKGAMTRMARMAGARAVQNRIEISEAAKAKAAARLESNRQRAAVKRDAAAVPRK